MHCPRCGPGTPISVEMTPDRGKVRICETCKMPLDAAEAETVGYQAKGAAERARVAAPPIQQALPPAPVVRRTRSRSTNFDVLQAARAQLRELNREIKRLEKLRIKRDKLKRLLDAADGVKPVAVVRQIQNATG
jgi:hypothetical protein